MNFTQILIIVSAVLVILLLWILVGVRNLKNLLLGIKDEWESLGDSLRKRQDIVPNLIEIVRNHSDKQEKLMEKLIEARRLAAKEYNPGAKKIELEVELSVILNKVLDLGRIYKDLHKDIKFLELRQEIRELEEDVEIKTKKYNEMVRYYNKHREFVLLKPLATLFKFSRVNIFEFEG